MCMRWRLSLFSGSLLAVNDMMIFIKGSRNAATCDNSMYYVSSDPSSEVKGLAPPDYSRV